LGCLGSKTTALRVGGATEADSLISGFSVTGDEKGAARRCAAEVPGVGLQAEVCPPDTGGLPHDIACSRLCLSFLVFGVAPAPCIALGPVGIPACIALGPVGMPACIAFGIAGIIVTDMGSRVVSC
jgi:hypothetical protein